MFNSVPENSSLCFSFTEKFTEIRELFRANQIGGLTNVFHRHFDLTGGSDSPIAARTVPNGDKLTHAIFLDFNSMYLWSQAQEMPLTPGINWIMKNGYFMKQIMASQMSLSQIQWIQYLETTDVCVDKDGNRHRIENGYYRGEYEFDQIKPDGYLFIDGVHRFFEFLGMPLIENSVSFKFRM